MRVRQKCCAVISALLVALLLPSGAALAEQRSATTAVDVNGFSLGMTIAEARQMAELTYLGGDGFEAAADGIDYNFGVTPLGRIYRVQSTQELGRFAVDRQFLATVRQRLTSKYGPPTLESGDVFSWNLVEPVTDRFGQTTPFNTMWMSAMVGGYDGEPTLDITILDFRILWADQAQANAGSREAGEDRVRF